MPRLRSPTPIFISQSAMTVRRPTAPRAKLTPARAGPIRGRLRLVHLLLFQRAAGEGRMSFGKFCRNGMISGWTALFLAAATLALRAAEPAPPFDLPRHGAEGRVRLEDFAGQILVLDFFA